MMTTSHHLVTTRNEEPLLRSGPSLPLLFQDRILAPRRDPLGWSSVYTVSLVDNTVFKYGVLASSTAAPRAPQRTPIFRSWRYYKYTGNLPPAPFCMARVGPYKYSIVSVSRSCVHLTSAAQNGPLPSPSPFSPSSHYPGGWIPRGNTGHSFHALRSGRGGLRGGALLRERRWHRWDWLVAPSLSPAFMRSLRRLDTREDHNVRSVSSTYIKL